MGPSPRSMRDLVGKEEIESINHELILFIYLNIHTLICTPT